MEELEIPHFPHQQAISTNKPPLINVLEAVDKWCRDSNKAIPYFNIEIKSRPEWDNLKTPPPATFAALVYQIIQPYKDKVCIQSFDPRSLKAVKAIDPELSTALLVSNKNGLVQNLDSLGYTPEIYSPNHQLVTNELVDSAHALSMRVIPWTVNDTIRMQELIALGVDGIITDYPNWIK